jgi:protoporphyrinogen/coproporphyrinogen III oxidase
MASFLQPSQKTWRLSWKPLRIIAKPLNFISKKIAILGAGITGLSAAYALIKQGHSVSVFESSNEVGGALRTTVKHGYLAEHGPNSIMLNDLRVTNLLDELNLTDRIIEADHTSAKRFIIKNSKPCPMPYSIGSLLFNKVLTLPTLLRIACEPFIGRSPNLENQSFADYVRHRLGENMLNYAAGAFVNGIYAGDPEKLHFRLAFPRMYKLVDENTSLILSAIKKPAKNPNKPAKKKIISFQNGMQELPDAFQKKLIETGCQILTEVSNSKIKLTSNNKWIYHFTHQGSEHQQEFDQVIVTVPAHRLHTIHFPENIRLDHTKAIYHPPVASLFLGYRRSDVKHPLDGFGMLASLPEETDILGALFTSTLFPDHQRAPSDYVAINVMLGGARNPSVASLPESEMIATAHRELVKNLGITGEPSFHHLTRWQNAIPQVNIGHENVLHELDKIESENPGLKFAGNYRNGISVGDCLINGIDQ